MHHIEISWEDAIEGGWQHFLVALTYISYCETEQYRMDYHEWFDIQPGLERANTVVNIFTSYGFSFYYCARNDSSIESYMIRDQTGYMVYYPSGYCEPSKVVTNSLEFVTKVKMFIHPATEHYHG